MTLVLEISHIHNLGELNDSYLWGTIVSSFPGAHAHFSGFKAKMIILVLQVDGPHTGDRSTDACGSQCVMTLSQKSFRH